jgi:hypothetical protein
MEAFEQYVLLVGSPENQALPEAGRRRWGGAAGV